MDRLTEGELGIMRLSCEEMSDDFHGFTVREMRQALDAIDVLEKKVEELETKLRGERGGWWVYEDDRPGRPVRVTTIGDCVLTHISNFRPATPEELKEWIDANKEES